VHQAAGRQQRAHQERLFDRVTPAAHYREEREKILEIDKDIQEVHRRDAGKVSCEHLALVYPVGGSARGL